MRVARSARRPSPSAIGGVVRHAVRLMAAPVCRRCHGRTGVVGGGPSAPSSDVPRGCGVSRSLRRQLGIAGAAAAFVAAAGIAHGVEIWQIQGSGTSSPLHGQVVTTEDNTVTAVGSGFFVMQTPEDRSDGDLRTSDGILVRRSASAPVVHSGDRVSVRGRVVEHYGQTELRDGTEVTVTSRGHRLPNPIRLDRSTPSPTQPWPEIELERFEGMRVSVEAGVVTGPTDRYGDAVITASGERLFREPGIAYPGLPGLPVWDGNPEAFELDPDAVGGDHVDLAAGTRFRSEGVLAYVFGSYQLWPTSLAITETPLLLAVPPVERRDTLTVASQNCARLAAADGDVPYRDRLEKLSRYVREVLGGPDIVAVQEVDSLAVLEDLADQIAADQPELGYRSFLTEGNDPSGIDVGLLVSNALPVLDVEQIGADVRFTWDQSLLFDRPPLVLETGIAELDLTVVVVHLKSLGGIDDPGDAGERVRRKRFEQSVWLSDWVQRHQTDRPGAGLLLLGDFNAFEFSDGYVDVLGQITGRPDPAGALLPAETDVDPPLVNLVGSARPHERYSFVYRGSAEVLDHALVDETLRPLVRGMTYARGNADAPTADGADPATARRSSDHDGLVVTLGPPVRSGGGRRSP